MAVTETETVPRPAHEEAPLRLAVIIGSTREGRFGPVVAEWLAAHVAERADMEIDIVDPVETPLPNAFPRFDEPMPEAAVAQIGAVAPRLAAADAFVIVTPEYNHSFPAGLKNLIDWHNEEWHAKPVGFVSYGGISGGLRSIEQLRLVLAELNATTIRNTVSFHNYYDKFDADGRATDPASDGAAKSMLDQLGWWARALKDARSLRPYAV